MFAFLRCWQDRHEPSDGSVHRSNDMTSGRCRHCGHGVRLNSRGKWVRRHRRHH